MQDDTRWSIAMQTDNQLDISISLSTFFLKNVGVWMSDNSDEQRRMKMLFIYTIWMLFCGTIISTRDLYFTLLYNGVSMFKLFRIFYTDLNCQRRYFIVARWILKIQKLEDPWLESFVIFVIFEGGKFCKHLFILIDNDDECFFFVF